MAESVCQAGMVGECHDAPLVDPRQLWGQLTPAERDHIGACALAHGLGVLGEEASASPGQGFAAASLHGSCLVVAEVAALAGRYFGGDLPRPDLSVLGIRACRRCGCTDDCGCADGCSWVAGETDLCSRCGDEA